MRLKNLNSLTFLRISFFLFVGFIAVSCNKDKDPNAQIKAEIANIDAYLETDGIEPTLYDQTGMRMVVHQIGDNPTPRTGQTVSFEYEIKLFSTGDVVGSGVITDKLE